MRTRGQAVAGIGVLAVGAVLGVASAVFAGSPPRNGRGHGGGAALAAAQLDDAALVAGAVVFLLFGIAVLLPAGAAGTRSAVLSAAAMTLGVAVAVVGAGLVAYGVGGRGTSRTAMLVAGVAVVLWGLGLLLTGVVALVATGAVVVVRSVLAATRLVPPVRAARSRVPAPATVPRSPAASRQRGGRLI